MTPNDDRWLTLAQAARQLNVHPTTLRRWANEGQIPVMITPGGHRRFSALDVARFKQARHSVRPAGGISRMWAVEAIAETRRQVSRPEHPAWMMKFDDAARARHRVLGQRLMGLLLQYVSGRNHADAILPEARQIGREYAANAKRLGLPLKHALEASMFFRDALVGSTMQLPENAHIRAEEKMRLLERINELLNTVQLTVAEEYDADTEDRLSRA